MVDNAAVRDEMAGSAEAYLRGKIADEEVDACTKSIKSATNKVPVNGSVLCVFFYWRIHLESSGKNFTGNAGGIGSIGGASTNGDIYTDDIGRLFSETDAFQFNSAAVYLNVNFFTKDSQYLGSYHGGGVGTCFGTGGGSGVWS